MNGKPTVFVVDDEPAVRASLAALLEADEWQVASCDSAESFLRRYESASHACLILDLRMPGKGGLELLSELHSRGEKLPIIVITGRYDSSETAECLAGGTLAIFQKPFEGESLVETVRQALAGQQASGSLTSLSKRLSPEEAQELYRAILPPLVREIFKATGGEGSESAIQRIVDHMCRTDVQAKLRQSTHVSDAISVELTTVLNDFRLKRRITAARLRKMIQRARLQSSLAALEGCLT